MSNVDMDYCRREFETRFAGDEEIRALLAQHEGIVEQDGAVAAPILCKLIEEKLAKKEPFSIVRVGNGEGNAVSMTLPDLSAPRERGFFVEFNSQNGLPIPTEEAVGFCNEVTDALLAGDVVGFRLLLWDEVKSVRRYLETNNEYAALGITYAREFLKTGLVEGKLRGKFITSAWLHLYILPYLEHILASARSVIVITGRWELEESFSARLGGRLAEFITVPVQGHRPKAIEDSHFGRAFPDVRRRLQRDLSGVLVLVGAGLFGKVYVATAKASGAVAIDLGSAFDILAGLQTRPVHRLFPCGEHRWVG